MVMIQKYIAISPTSCFHHLVHPYPTGKVVGDALALGPLISDAIRTAW